MGSVIMLSNFFNLVRGILSGSGRFIYEILSILVAMRLHAHHHRNAETYKFCSNRLQFERQVNSLTDCVNRPSRAYTMY